MALRRPISLVLSVTVVNIITSPIPPTIREIRNGGQENRECPSLASVRHPPARMEKSGFAGQRDVFGQGDCRFLHLWHQFFEITLTAIVERNRLANIFASWWEDENRVIGIEKLPLPFAWRTPITLKLVLLMRIVLPIGSESAKMATVGPNRHSANVAKLILREINAPCSTETFQLENIRGDADNGWIGVVSPWK